MSDPTQTDIIRTAISFETIVITFEQFPITVLRTMSHKSAAIYIESDPP